MQMRVDIGLPRDHIQSAKKESARVRDVCVEGSTVFVAKGQLFLP